MEEGFIEENGLGIDFEIVGGNRGKNVDNPGNLVVECKQKFLFNRKIDNNLHITVQKRKL